MSTIQKADRVYDAIAASLRKFGYPSTTAAQIREVHEDLTAKRPLRHGIVGMFAKKQIDEAVELGLLSSAQEQPAP
jgi:hypothetical protein